MHWCDGALHVPIFYSNLSDKERPTITGCPGAQSANTAPGSATANVPWTEPTATDNSGNQTLTQTHQPGSPFPIGITTVTYTSTDPIGNTATCSFDVTVKGRSIDSCFMMTLQMNF